MMALAWTNGGLLPRLPYDFVYVRKMISLHGKEEGRKWRNRKHVEKERENAQWIMKERER